LPIVQSKIGNRQSAIQNQEIGMLLESKTALVFAATGAIAGSVARRFAQEGAHVYASGRNEAALKQLVKEIEAAGGKATAHVVDATDEAAVNAYVHQVAAAAGRIDIVFNGIGGAIVTLSATLSGMTAANMAGISAACSAIEGMTRALAGEFGPAGVRANCVRGSAMPETRTIQETVAGQIAVTGKPPAMALPPLGRPISVDETAKAAAFLASDFASGMTGQVVTVCAGAFVG
jgi:NAD(P)-dependent dehydrogenase (short-subunit alcohol dehydrogenase family)